MGVQILSWGHYSPKSKLTNKELAERFKITEEWIINRTGIEERTYFKEGATSDMILNAALECIATAEINPTEIDCVIVATMTPDHYCPSTAAIVHNKLGTLNAWGFDIMAACTGYLYALQLAKALINSKSYRTILVCGADKMSSCVDPTDRKTTLVLADGAGVTLLQHSENTEQLVDIICKLDSSNYTDIITQSGSKNPVGLENIAQGSHYLRFASKNIFNTAVSSMEKITFEILKQNGLSIDDIDYIVPHQANKKIIETLADRMNIPINKFLINIERIGNTTAATIPLLISQYLNDNKLKGNERLLSVSVGAGYTYAAAIIELKK